MVTKLAAQGEAHEEIAGHLDISERTVNAHLHNAYRELHIRHRMELLQRGVGRTAS